MPGMFGMPRNRCSLRSPPECQHLLGGGSRRGDWVDAGKGAETAIYGVPLDLQLDSGSGITIISRQNWVNVGSPPTSPPDCNEQTASGDKLGIEAMFRATNTIGGTHKESNCYVCLGRTIFVVLQAGRNSNTESASGRTEGQVLRDAQGESVPCPGAAQERV
ncbi:uncharacterized protein LOC120417967 [Culex pipiens pallens]|uniref:uncharacterized protein LOC120417967 n=1 Tax=Culex pipiens pallens TaxID=42434 RepID=UPI001953A619|nr:uncharacterized protein LOC120417967 [Culex pipiens pallens]